MNVLIVDDIPDNLFLLEKFINIKCKEANVIKAYSGKEAIEKFQEEHMDVVIMDFNMPEMSGTEAIKRRDQVLYLHGHPHFRST